MRSLLAFALLFATAAHAVPRPSSRRHLAYFEALISDGSLTGAAIDRMLAAHGTTGRLGNAILFPSGADALARRKAMDSHLTGNHAELASFLRDRRAQLRGATEQVDELRRDTGLDTPLRFIRLEPKGPTQTPTLSTKDGWFNLHRPLEVLDRHVTQGQWMARMGSNPSHFRLGPSYPVDSVKPQTTAFLFALDAETPLYRHRLPTHEEWLYFASDQGTNRHQLLHDFDWRATLEHAWVQANAGDEPREVATRKPTVLAGQPIYDVVGLIGDLVEDGGFRRWALGGWLGTLGPFKHEQGMDALLVPPTAPRGPSGCAW